VAVKILPPDAGHDAAFAERFAREARAMARLNHPHVVSVYDFGQSDGQYYLVMEYVDGVNLRQAIRSGSVTPQAALEIVSQICGALQYAHDEGVVHRDIKPENILLDRRGRVKIADFGLAKLLRVQTHDLTGTHQVMGTPRYMAPEQLEGSRDVDHRADIYSLGVVFYELLTGEVPMGSFQPPSAKVAVDVRVDEVVLKSLQREPERRYQHASEVKSDVERCSDIRIQSVQPGASPDADDDFVLMNPRLPRVAQWISVYTIVAKPLLWLIVTFAGVLSLSAALVEHDLEKTLTIFVAGLCSVIDFMFVVVVAVGGFKLRALLQSGPRWIKVGLAANIVIAVAAFALTSMLVPWELEFLRGQARTNPELLIGQGFTQQEVDSFLADAPRPVTGPDLVAAFLAIVLIALDLVVLVWLMRHGRHLPLRAAPLNRRAAPEVAEPQVPRLSKLAVASVITTLPALFLLLYLFFMLAQQGVPAPLRLLNAPDFGEVAATFLLVPGVIGIACGAAALHRIHNSGGRLYGIYLAAAAIVFYAALALSAVLIPLLASVISMAFGTLSEEELKGPKGLLVFWAVLLPIAAIDFVIARRTWRRFTQPLAATR
jgi:hypothetical protein